MTTLSIQWGSPGRLPGRLGEKVQPYWVQAAAERDVGGKPTHVAESGPVARPGGWLS